MAQTKGVELAAGYIDLSVKWNSAADQIARDFLGLQKQADRAGTRSGEAMSDSLTRALTRGGDEAGDAFTQKFRSQLDGQGRAMTARLTGDLESQSGQSGRTAGKRWADNFERSASGAKVNVRSVGEGAGEDAGDSFMGGFGGSIAGLGARGGPIGAALAAAAVTAFALGKPIAQQVIAGMQAEVDRGVVAASLGLDPESVGKISEAAGNAFLNNWGSSIAANMSTATAAVQAGLADANDPKALQKVIEQLTSVSTLLGEDIPSVARSASQAIRTGMATDVAGAFDIIVKGQQSGLNVSGDWLDTLNEYSTQFRKLGLDGPESMALISQALKGGARDTDIAADALKEFSIRAVDDSKLTREAFSAMGFDADVMRDKFAAGGDTAKGALDQIFDGLRAIKDPAEQSRVAVALFGTQAEDLGAALINFDLSKAVTEFGRVEGASQAAADTMSDNTMNEWQTAKNNLVNWAAEIREAWNMDEWGLTIPKAINEWLAPPPTLKPGEAGVPPSPVVTSGPAFTGPASGPNRPGTGNNPLDIFTGASNNADSGGVMMPNAAATKKFYESQGFTVGGYSPADSPEDEHQTGQATDVMIPSLDAGYAVLPNALRRPGVQYVIFDNKMWYPDGSTKGYSGPSPHTDHLHIRQYDQGGWWKNGVLGINQTGEDELVLNPDHLQNLRDQGIDPNTLLHGGAQGAPPGPAAGSALDAAKSGLAAMRAPAGDPGSGRTEGYIPAGAGNSSVAGTSFLSGLYGMGGDVIKGVIDQAASAAASAAGMAAGAGSMGAAGGAGASAAQFAIGLGTQALKRGVDWGAQMLGIGTDALIEQLTPFGAPRWISTDPTAFMPQPLMDAATTTIEKALGGKGPGGPVQPGQLPGTQGVGAPAPKANAGGVGAPSHGAAAGAAAGVFGGKPPGPVPGPQQGGASTAASTGYQDMLKRIGVYDGGGWLNPGEIGINRSNRPEPMAVFNASQWDNLSTIANSPVAEVDPSAGGTNDYRTIIENVTVKDVAEMYRMAEDRQQLATMRYRGRPSGG